jgi:chromosome partitioning protein
MLWWKVIAEADANMEWLAVSLTNNVQMLFDRAGSYSSQSTLRLVCRSVNHEEICSSRAVRPICSQHRISAIRTNGTVLHGGLLVARTVAIINMKGGVGKTTIAVNLAWYAAHHLNERVLVVDLDPQFNASQMLLGSARYTDLADADQPTICEILERPRRQTKLVAPQDVIVNVRAWNDGSGIDLVPSTLELAWTLKAPGGMEQRLKRFLGKVRKKYDTIFIDCAPTESALTTAAYLASDYLLVPARPEFLSTIGLPLLVRSFTDFKADYPRHRLHLAGIVFNCASRYRGEYQRSTRYVRDLAADQVWHIFDTELAYSDSYAKGAREGTPIFSTSYARWEKVSNFRRFADEFFGNINGARTEQSTPS